MPKLRYTPPGIGYLNTKYLKLSGGTMTGALVITPAVNGTSILNVTNVVGTSVLNVDTTNGRVGIGTTAPTQKLEVAGNLLLKSGRLSVGKTALNSNYVIEAFANETATTGEKRALSFAITGNPSADWGNTSILGLNGFAEHQANYNALGSHFGGFFGARNSGTSTLWVSYGAFLEIQNTSTGTCDYAVASVASIKDTGGGNFTNAYGLLTQAEVASGGTIGYFYGAYLKNPTGAGAVTNNYALYIENQTKGGTINYSIYSAGGANYFAGSLQTNAGFGCNTKSPQASYSVNAASSDLATVIALCNQLRAALIANGICV